MTIFSSFEARAKAGPAGGGPSRLVVLHGGGDPSDLDQPEQTMCEQLSWQVNYLLLVIVKATCRRRAQFCFVTTKLTGTAVITSSFWFDVFWCFALIGETAGMTIACGRLQLLRAGQELILL